MDNYQRRSSIHRFQSSSNIVQLKAWKLAPTVTLQAKSLFVKLVSWIGHFQSGNVLLSENIPTIQTNMIADDFDENELFGKISNVTIEPPLGILDTAPLNTNRNIFELRARSIITWSISIVWG